jgi:hypothetical protein
MQPKLDHLIQYKVERFSTHDKKPAIVFENGVKIITDRVIKNKLQKEFVGQRLLNVWLAESGAETLFFGNGMTLELMPGYRLYDPVSNSVIDPDDEPVNELPPDPSPDRLKEGPDEDNEEES